MRCLFRDGKDLCFCDKCLDLFNKKYGYQYTRETIKDDFLYNSKKVRKEYIEFQIETLGNFARIIARAIHSVSPNTIVAMQNGGNTPLVNDSQKACLDAMKEETGLAPAFRAGGGFYDDHTPANMLDKAMQLHYINSRLPEYVKMRNSEIENIPDVAYGKSYECCCIEAALYIAYGCNMASITLKHPNESLSYYEGLFKKLNLYKPYLRKLVDSNKGTLNGGVCVYQPKKSHLNYMKHGSETAWNATSIWEAKNMMRHGIPFHAGPSGDVYLLSSKACDYLCDDDVEMLLNHPVITDAASIEKLISLGYGDKIRANVEKIDNKYLNVFYEKKLSHPINDNIHLENWCDSRYYGKDPKYIITGDDIEKVSEYCRYLTDEVFGCAFAIVKTTYGAKWAVKGAHLCTVAVSHERRNQTRLMRT